MMTVSYNMIDYGELDKDGFPRIHNVQDYVESKDELAEVFGLCKDGTFGPIDWNTFRITNHKGKQFGVDLVVVDL